MAGKIVPDQEVTEGNPSLPGIECGQFTFGDGTEKPSFWVGRGITVAMTPKNFRGDDEVKGYFHPQIPVKFKRFGYIKLTWLI